MGTSMHFSFLLKTLFFSIAENNTVKTESTRDARVVVVALLLMENSAVHSVLNCC